MWNGVTVGQWSVRDKKYKWWPKSNQMASPDQFEFSWQG